MVTLTIAKNRNTIGKYIIVPPLTVALESQAFFVNFDQSLSDRKNMYYRIFEVGSEFHGVKHSKVPEEPA